MNYRLLLPFILTCTSFSAAAEQRWFEVELLLFQRGTEIKNVSEQLAADNISVDTTNSISMLKAQADHQCQPDQSCLNEQLPVVITAEQFDSENNVFQLLDESQLQLTEQRKKLKNHASFTPVVHLAWRMPVDSRSKALPIHLFAGKNLAFTVPSEEAKSESNEPAVLTTETELTNTAITDTTLIESTETTAAELDISSVLPPAVQQTDKWEIDGNFKVYLQHYLFIDSQLVIRQTAKQDIEQAEETALTEFEVIDGENDVQIINQTDPVDNIPAAQETVIKEVLFDQNRRLRSEEIHYLDHPLMGMIVQIRKIPAKPESE
ncbi:peptidoglycan binding protein CsiV [Psychromonas ossibalaenae]|uniref:peptidoglycan binding protein CsiV n=1 Tax=Psychromonas ossibalaenae TaxID=444922 RepID=UPI000363787E|nr:peptidoglycan binding protein CsiV [Psychromonas ossibalaenae]